MMRAYVGTFTKKNGDTRTMNFARLPDLPTGFLNSQLTGTGTARTLEEGLELVWDLERNAFRVFNHNTVVGTVDQYEHHDVITQATNTNNTVINS